MSQKLCKNCKHISKESWFVENSNRQDAWCENVICRPLIDDPVFGPYQAERPHCSVARDDDTIYNCGAIGMLFEMKHGIGVAFT
jgi:hypothetical protein